MEKENNKADKPVGLSAKKEETLFEGVNRYLKIYSEAWHVRKPVNLSRPSTAEEQSHN